MAIKRIRTGLATSLEQRRRRLDEQRRARDELQRLAAQLARQLAKVEAGGMAASGVPDATRRAKLQQSLTEVEARLSELNEAINAAAPEIARYEQRYVEVRAKRALKRTKGEPTRRRTG